MCGLLVVISQTFRGLNIVTDWLQCIKYTTSGLGKLGSKIKANIEDYALHMNSVSFLSTI